jgi:hypothetical protein
VNAQQTHNKQARQALGFIFVIPTVAGAVLVLGAAFLLAYQCYQYLRFGEWPPYTVAVLWAYFQFPPVSVGWVGLQAIINSLTEDILGWPLTLSMFLIGSVVGLLGFIGIVATED